METSGGATRGDTTEVYAVPSHEKVTENSYMFLQLEDKEF